MATKPQVSQNCCNFTSAEVKSSISVLSKCCACALLRFRYKKHVVRVRDTSWFGFKYLFCLRIGYGLTSCDEYLICFDRHRNGWRCLLVSLKTRLEISQDVLKNTH